MNVTLLAHVGRQGGGLLRWGNRLGVAKEDLTLSGGRVRHGRPTKCADAQSAPPRLNSLLVTGPGPP